MIPLLAAAMMCLPASVPAPVVAVQEAPAEALPRRTLISGMAGLYTRSRIVFFEAPDLPHDLQVVFMFPDRARIQLSAVGAGFRARQLEYRSGDAFYFVESYSSRSTALEATPRNELHLRLELRRALMLWPDGPTWSIDDELRTTVVPGVGTLEAQLDDGGRPSSMRALDDEGTELEAYSAIEWREQGGRWWPRAMEFSYRGNRVWSEEVQELNARPTFLDWFFVPADRRALEPQSQSLPDKVMSADLPPTVMRRIEVDGSLDWKDLLARAAELVTAARDELDPLGLGVEDPVSFLLSDAGRPTHCELRLTTQAETPPPGWTAVSERPGLTVFGKGPPARVPQLLERLRSLAPADATLGRAYLRARPSAGPEGDYQVVLPLVP